MNESCPIYQCIMSQTRMSHVSYINESWRLTQPRLDEQVDEFTDLMKDLRWKRMELLTLGLWEGRHTYICIFMFGCVRVCVCVCVCKNVCARVCVGVCMCVEAHGCAYHGALGR